MAREELVEIVREGRRAVARWRRDNPDAVLDLVDVDLSGADLAGVNFRHSQLVGADLSAARLNEANLFEADLTRANLTGAKLSRANLAGASLFRATLREVRGTNVDLSRCNLQGADLTDAVLSASSLVDADLRESDLSGAALVEVDFSHADLDRTTLDRVCCGWLTWNNVDLSRTIGLESLTHLGPGSIGLDTLERSGARIPQAFLQGNGVSQEWIENYLAVDEPVAASDVYFIVHGEEDEPFASKLHNTLQKHGVRCWLDSRRDADDAGVTGLVPARGIRVWDRVLVCATRATLSADWMGPLIESVYRREEAIKQQTGDSVLLMWPLNLDGFLLGGGWKHDAAPEVAGRLLADFTGWRRNKTKFHSELKKLIERLQQESGGRAARRTGNTS